MYQFKIGDKFTSTDWGLLLSSYDVGEPSPKTMYINIPASDGSLDLSQSLTGDIKFSNRKITAKFTIITARSGWQSKIDEIKAYCHGKKLNIIAPNDDTNYYVGRVTVGSLVKGSSSAEFTITIDCDPYKLANTETTYNFTIGVSATLTTTLVNTRKPVIPTFTVSKVTNVVFGTVSVSLPIGTTTTNKIVLAEGNNSITFNALSTTTIAVKYRKGAL